MQKYKLINLQTKGEHLCDKVTIDGFNYYVSDEEIKESDWYLAWETINNIESNHIVQKATDSEPVGMYSWASNYKKVIATNNPNIDILKVVDEVEEIVDYSESLAKSLYNPEAHRNDAIKSLLAVACQSGYNKSQETHPFSEEDVIEFAEFVAKYTDKNKNHKGEMLHAKSKYDGSERTKDLLQLWKEQKPKKVYYEN